jgi:hypothetical protein
MMKRLKRVLASMYGASRTTVWPATLPGFDPVRMRFEEECG